MKNKLSLLRVFEIHGEHWKLILFFTLILPMAYKVYQHTKEPYFIGNSIIQIGTINGNPALDPEQLVELLKMKSVQAQIINNNVTGPAEIEPSPYINALNQAKILRPVKNIQISFKDGNPDVAKDASLRIANSIAGILLARDHDILNLDSEAEISIKTKLANLKSERVRLLDLIRDNKLNDDSGTSVFSQNVLLLSIIGSKESEINFLENELIRLQKNQLLHSANKSKVYFKSLDSMNNASSFFEIKLVLIALLGYIMGLGLAFVKANDIRFR